MVAAAGGLLFDTLSVSPHLEDIRLGRTRVYPKATSGP